MSLENNLKRIADSLEKIAEAIANPLVTIDIPPPMPTPVPDAPTPAAPVAEAPAAPVVQEVPAAPAAIITTPEGLNAALVDNVKRGVSQDAIRTAMAAAPFGATAVTDLAVDQYDALVAVVAALPAS